MATRWKHVKLSVVEADIELAEVLRKPSCDGKLKQKSQSPKIRGSAFKLNIDYYAEGTPACFS